MMNNYTLYRDPALDRDNGRSTGIPENRKWPKNCKIKYIFQLVFAIGCMLGSGNIFGQSFSFAQSTATYTASSATTVLGASGWDDNLYTASIPFSFNFNGTNYSSTSVNSNGYITFGPTVSASNNYTPISAATAFAGAASAFGIDLISNSSTITTGTEGSSPNRVFVIQWNNCQRYAFIGGQSGDVLNFQIRLSETTNAIAVRYGTCTATSTTAYTSQVGVRGATNAVFYNRTSTTSWSLSGAGTASTNTMTSKSTVMPASGLTFTYTPAVATQCATPVSPANGATNVTDVTLTWTAPSSGPVATSYDVYVGTTTPPSTLIANVATTSITITGYAASTLYYWRIIPKSATGSDATGCTIRSFTTGNPFLPYCNSGVTYTTSVEPITLVNFAGINRSSSATVGGTPALENYIADIGNVTSANSYNITLKGNTAGNFQTFFTVFIDWNHDGILTGSNEIYTAGSVTNSSGVDAIQAVTSIAVPESALSGTTRMRVKKLYGSASNDPCTGGGYGQSEDYTINVTACTPTTWYADADADTYGNPAVTQSKCLQPAGYVANNGDCNDADATKHASYNFYVDADHDNFGTGSLVSVCAVNASTPPFGYSTNNTDCNDADVNKHATFPFYADTDGDTYGTGSTSNQCAVNAATPPSGYSLNNTDCAPADPTKYQSATLYIDVDGDGYNNGTSVQCYGASIPAGYSTTTSGTDCNDNDATKHASFPFYADTDGDTYGSGSLTSACAVNGTTPPSGYSLNNTDCAPADPTKYQSATLYIDADGDGYNNGTSVQCYGAAIPSGYSASTLGSDCNDANASVYQSATLYIDADGDGYNNGTSVQCYGATIPSGYSASTLGSDCNDANAAVYQSATLYIDVDGDGYNNGTSVQCYGASIPAGYSTTTNGTDCNDNDATKHASFPFYADTDGDTYGSGSLTSACAVNGTTPPSGYSLNNTDCAPADPTKYQSATLYIDADGDGYNNGTSVQCYGAAIPSGYSASTLGSDCNDANAAVYQSATLYIDADGDGYDAGTQTVCYGASIPAGYSATTNGTDCNDSNAAVYQSATLYIDADADGYDAGTQTVCYGASIPAGYSATTNGTDCNDSNAAVYQSATLYIDADADGYDNGTSVQCYGAAIPTGYSASTLGSDCNDSNAAVYQSASLYIDADGDGYDAGTQTVCYGATVPTGYSASTLGSDCDDNDATKHATFPFYADLDGDSYGAGSLTSACAVNGTTPPAGYSLNNTDCNDANAAVYQSASLYIDADGDGYDAGTSVQCYGAAIPTGYSASTLGSDCNDSNAAVYQSATLYIDADGDGYDAGTSVQCYGAAIPTGYSASTLGSDCDDTDASKHQTYQFFADTDGDGYGTGSLVFACAVNDATPPTGYADNNTDCNDANPAAYQNVTYYIDADGDGYDAGTALLCSGASAPSGYSATTLGSDCNDANAAVYQSASLYIDADGDGYDAGTSVQCYGATVPTGYSATTNGADCNDANAAVYQSASLYIDADGDGYDNGTSVQCYGATVPSGYSASTLGSDCNDNDATKHATFPFYADLDGDTYGAGSLTSACAVNGTTPPAGYSLSNTDCNDANPAVYQSASLYTDADGDHYTVGAAQSVCYGATIPAGYSATTLGTDCNDNNAAVYQNGTFYVDADGDNYTTGVTAVVCYGATTPAGYITSNTAVDCNDAVAAINPGHAEVLYNGVDDNCDGNLDEGNQLKTKLLPESCGVTLAAINSLIGITTVSSAITGYRIRVTNGSQVQVIEKNVPHFTLTELPSYAYATTYSVDIQLQRQGIWLGYYGDTCLVSSPPVLSSGGATQVSPSQCGNTLPRINTLIATTSLAGVTGYRFRVTNMTTTTGPNVVQIIDRSINWFQLQMLVQYNYGTTYQIEVAIKTTGTYGGYGAACNVTSPAPPSLEPCGGTIAASTTRVAASSLSGVTQYRFQIQRDLNGALTSIDRNTNYFTFAQIPGYAPNELYNVRVAVMTTGTWSPFSDYCQITSPPSVARHMEQPQADTDALFSAVAYPNPFANDFKVNVTTTSSDKVQVAVYDMAGRLIETRQAEATDVSTQEVGSRYAAGVYNVIVTQGANVQTLRVVKR